MQVDDDQEQVGMGIVFLHPLPFSVVRERKNEEYFRG